MSDSSQHDPENAEDGGPKIAASDELEAALEEAIASSEKREAEEKASADGEGAPSTDKMTIELLSRELQDLKGLHEEKLAELAEKDDALRWNAALALMELQVELVRQFSGDARG